MPPASYLQTSFTGGKWSKFAQGRADKETYRSAMNECFNSFPAESGYWRRRDGTIFCATTRSGLPATLRPFHFSQNAPYVLEFTDGHLRVFSGQSLVLDSSAQAVVSSMSSANPAAVATLTPHGLTTGDQVEFHLETWTAGGSLLMNRQFTVAVTGANGFTISDPVTGAGVDGSTITYVPATGFVIRVLDYTTPYLDGSWSTVRVVQDENLALILNTGAPPLQIANLTSPTVGAQTTFSSLENVTFVDGPYLDPPVDGTTLTPSGTSGSITLTASSIASINGGQGFLATDVGRFIRLFSEPAAWASGTAYPKGANVKYNGAYYQAYVANTGIEPDTDPSVNWTVATNAANWTWAIVTTITSTSEVTATLQPADPLGTLAGGPLLYNRVIAMWQLGLYSDTTGWPTGGCYQGGRFWLFGAQGNRIDSTMSDNGFIPETTALNCAPTGLDGTVADNNGCSFVLQASDINTIFWAIPTHIGIVLGTQAGEWLLEASSSNDPITPTSVDAHRQTRYGCANVEPVEAPLSMLFVQRYQLKLYEYMSDVYSRKFQGTNLAIDAKDLTVNGLQEIAWVNEPSPILWARDALGSLLGMVYKRESPFATQPASFFGWHHHALGSGRKVTCVRAGPSQDGTTDALMLVTNDPSTNIHYVEMMATSDEDVTLLNSWFVDAAVTPTFAAITGNTLTLYGLEYIAGKTVTAWIAGIDAGDYTVSVAGAVAIPLNGPGSPLTTTYLASLNGDYGALKLSVLGVPATSPPINVAAVANFTGSGTPAYDTPEYSGMIDWANGLGYFFRVDTGIVTHIDKFALAAPSVPLASVSTAATTILGAQTCGQDGNGYFAHALSGSNTGLSRLNAATMTISDLGVVQPYSSAITTLRAGKRVHVLTASLHGQHYLGGYAQGYQLTPGDGGGGGGIVGYGVGQADDGMFNVANTATARGPSITAAGEAWGTAFVISRNTAIKTLLTIYGVSTNEAGTSIGMAQTGTITDVAIDAAWTSITVFGAIYDPADGNLVLCLGGNAGAATPAYLVKTTPAGVVIWQNAVNHSITFSDNSRLNNQTFSVVSPLSVGGGKYRVYTVSTITGIMTYQDSANAFNLEATQYTDDVNGQLIFFQEFEKWAWATFAGVGTPPIPPYIMPAVIGFNYQSQGQLLRPLAPQETGAQEGPALGKTRRSATIAFLVANSQVMEFGTDFSTTLRAMTFHEADDATEVPVSQLYSGIYLDRIEDDYSYDSMPSWTTLRPYPASVLAVEAFIHTQDRH